MNVIYLQINRVVSFFVTWLRTTNQHLMVENAENEVEILFSEFICLGERVDRMVLLLVLLFIRNVVRIEYSHAYQREKKNQRRQQQNKSFSTFFVAIMFHFSSTTIHFLWKREAKRINDIKGHIHSLSLPAAGNHAFSVRSFALNTATNYKLFGWHFQKLAPAHSPWKI